ADAVSGSVPERARALTHTALEQVQRWLTDQNASTSRLVIVTTHAVAVTADDPIDPITAPIWGLIRSAQAENPGRFVLIDTDTDHTPALLAAATATGETELALRQGRLHHPRLTRHTTTPTVDDAPVWRNDGTVLITGGTGGLGALIARHLITHHGIRHLLLASRRGPNAPGATELAHELTHLTPGVTIDITACDAGDRDALATLLTTIPTDRPLRGVIHTAGIGDNALVGALTPERIDRVFQPKADAAWHLHELTQDMDLDAFVL
ncbi:beta-ketoacyl reductase, partial [Streptomyces sp. TBY4]|uniref:beta-ketoacyl reductase n=1 Tax=Streptomyces sp. TBY4 TaxID=2962030 RepID=UPI0020B770E9